MTKSAIYTSDESGDWNQELVNAEVDEVTWDLYSYETAQVGMDPLDPQSALILLDEMELQIRLNETEIIQVIPRKLGGGLDWMTIACEGLFSYFQDCFVTEYPLAYNADQLNIALALVTLAQSLSDQGRSIVGSAFGLSGIVRIDNINNQEFPNIYDLLWRYPKLQNGFDQSIEVYGDGRREWTPYYPRKGSYKPKYALELDKWGRKNIVDVQYNEDGISQANDIYITGATDQETQAKLVGRWTAAQANLNRFGRVQKVLSEGNIDSINWLNARAQGEGTVIQEAVKLPDIYVDGSLLGLIKTGDSVPVRIDWGRYYINGEYRIRSVTWQRDKDRIKLRIMLP